VPYQSHVRLTVHDALGRQLAQLSDNVHEAGVYENSWYPTSDNLHSGHYFVRLQAGSYVSTQKISVIR
jgi:hypothetical protein